MAEADEAHYQGEMLAANTPGARQIEVDMSVVGVDGEPVGSVKEVREGDFLVSRPMARDVYVPYAFVLAMEDPADRVRGGPTQPDQVVLTIGAASVDDQHWPRP